MIRSTNSANSAWAETIELGKARYRDDLPVDNQGNPRRLIKAKPSTSARIRGAVPTNDWCSSLVWPLHSEHSLPMFPHPLALQAGEKGLGVGYNPTPSVTSSRKGGRVFQPGTDYRFPYRQSMVVGLDSFTSVDCVLDDFSDWAVTALWENSEDSLRATFGHGLPFVYFERKSTKPFCITFATAEVNRHHEPVAPLSFTLHGVTGKHLGTNGRVHLSVNAGDNIGVGSKARLRYDFNGDGKTDRVETLRLLATDPSGTSWESYSSEKHLIDEALTHGARADFRDGSVTLEFWKCFGKGELQLNLKDCFLHLPTDRGRGGRKLFLTRKGGMESLPDDSIATLEKNAKSPGATVFHADKNVLGVTANGTHYGLFAPSGSRWDWREGADTEARATSDLAGKDYASVAVLPDAKISTIEWFRQHAFAFVTDTHVDNRYDAKNSQVVTEFSATTEVKEGEVTDTILSLYRHQFLHLADEEGLTEYRYAGPRGEMKVIVGNAFTTETPFLGVLPALPCAESSKRSLNLMVDAFVKDLFSRPEAFERTDTYWNGKELGKISEVIQIASQLGRTKVRDRLVELLESRMEDWFDGNDERFFYYDSMWGTLVGYPDSYGSADELNDHHFHYSYFIRAAATIAQFDPEWVLPGNYGGMIHLLIRTCANHDRDDKRFPWMRFFDPYAGHSWASGHAGFASGNNQESSSESMNFATSLILYGEATGDFAIRDLGIYWHATEAEAVRNYWFDTDGEVFPKRFGHSCVGMIWGDGGSYGTWWTSNPEEIHGINYLPLTGGSLYLGRDAEYTRRNFEDLVTSNRNYHDGGFDGDAYQLEVWQDVLMAYLALTDPVAAAEGYRLNGFEKEGEFGESKLHTLQWMGSLEAIGEFDDSVRADCPTAVTFRKDGKQTYVIYNGRPHPIKVKFTDGAVFVAKPGLKTFTR